MDLARFGGLFAALALAACTVPPPELPKAPVPAGPGVAIQSMALPLDPRDPAQGRLGNFTYAGGLALTSDQTSRLHGLSDLKVWPDGRLLSVSDEGDVLEARLILDSVGRLIGVADGRLTLALGEDGQPLSQHGKRESDSEGIAEFANGDRLISLEEDDRILVYPHAGGPPHRAPSPDVSFPFNLGMEALATLPAAGADAYLTGGEASGDIWLCHLAGGCVKQRTVPMDAGYGLAALEPLTEGRIAYLLRAWDPLQGTRITLRIEGPQGELVDELKLAKPLSVDNFEGVAAVATRGRPIRFYLISDDNFSKSQRTLLMAFDWTPPRGN